MNIYFSPDPKHGFHRGVVYECDQQRMQEICFPTGTPLWLVSFEPFKDGRYSIYPVTVKRSRCAWGIGYIELLHENGASNMQHVHNLHYSQEEAELRAKGVTKSCHHIRTEAEAAEFFATKGAIMQIAPTNTYFCSICSSARNVENHTVAACPKCSNAAFDIILLGVAA